MAKKRTIKPKAKPTATVEPVTAAAPLPIKEDMVTEPNIGTTYANGARTYEDYVRKCTGRDGMPREEVRKMLDEQTGKQRTWVMPDNSPEAQAARAAVKAEETKRRIFVHNDAAPVTVSVRGDDGPKTLAVYQNLADFKEQHDFGTYPVRETRSDKEATAILVGAKPWAGRVTTPKAANAAPRGRSKKDIIGDMLLRPEGVTSKEVCETMGWPSVSMPAQAKMVGLTLRKEKVEGVMRYWGIKS